MKTEKRLTMALSVLVALMMLAVPLASSSNLFVDGGQTNSNGDAPSLSAEEAETPVESEASAGDIITFELNIPENSLDKIDLDLIKTYFNTSANKVSGIIFSVDEKKGTILAITDGSEKVTIKSVIDNVNNAIGAQFRGKAYSHEWIDSNGSIYYVDDKSGNISESFTLTAKWTLNEDEYAEINVNSTIDGAAQEVKTKAYIYSTYKESGSDVVDKTQIVITTANGLPVDESLIKGYVLNGTNANKSVSVYEYKVTDSSNKPVKDPTRIIPNADVTIPVSDLTVTYTFNSQDFKKVTISSNIFEGAVTLYADKNVAGYTYNEVFTALGKATPEGKTKAYIDTSYVDEDQNSYTMKNWTDNGETYALTSESLAGTELTLNADYNKFNVTFMVNGQLQVVEVLYGEFSESVCTLDTSGMTKWVKLPVDSSSKVIYSGTDFKPAIFNFNDPKLQETVTGNNLVLVALFTDPAKTSYVTFNAGNGYFGDKEDGIQNIVVPIAEKSTADKIVVPENPTDHTVSQGKKSVFAYWYTNNKDVKYTFPNKEVDSSFVLTANYFDYKYALSFNADGKVIGHLYYSANSELAGFEYNGEAYPFKDGDLGKIPSGSEEALPAGSDANRALSALLYPTKAGYIISEWKDADGKTMISDIKHVTYDVPTDTPSYERVTGVALHYNTVSEDMTVSAEFDALSYTITYVNSLGGTSATQKAFVDQAVTLYGKDTFLSKDYTLIGWSTVPGESEATYKFGGSYTLSGAEYEKLLDASTDGKVIVNIYSVWQANTGSGSGDNTGGDDGNDNTALYLIAGMLAVIAILAIVGIVLMRKKN